MRRSTVTVSMWLSVCFFVHFAPSALAQSERYLCIHYTSNIAQVLAVDPNGNTVGTHLRPTTPYIHVRFLVPAGDNLSYFTGGNILGPHVIQRVWPGGTATVVAQLSRIDWMVEGDEEGEFFVHTVNGGQALLVTIRNKAIVRAVPSTLTLSWGACYNPATGHIAVNSFGGLGVEYFDVDPATGVAISLGQVRNTGSLSRSFCYDPAGGGEYIDGVSISSGGSVLVRIAASGGILGTTALPFSKVAAVARAPDASLPTRYRLIGSLTIGHRLLGVDQAGVIQKQASLTDCSVTGYNFLRRVGGDPVNQRVRTAPNDRELTLDFPALSGRPYVVAFSLTGAVGRGRLRDGRAIPLAIDAFTQAALAGTFTGLLRNTIGVLNGNGSAVSRIDANVLGSALRGQRLWAAAAVLDPTAPSGVAQLSDPVMLTFR